MRLPVCWCIRLVTWLTRAGTLSMAKCFAKEMAVKVVSDALQLMGAMAICRTAPVERIYRDVRQMLIVEGTSEIQRIDYHYY